ncbi:L-rhamnose/proton symporter RhaT [Luteolibacter ambystomatis]|uniref:L-rhamnose/proton symporter RhaT n=1 Tax=Luteolibacter ambystomatis TaxID=2824561 RepID=A0A975J1K8_9BACT|nr:L-rhamnose/proton symporter RhaT [Luteolibacter ambystomatis]QUE52350.1 L-rhamnose/proton symporter RhaT [Luteolibacter ambystomatis]
MNPLIGVVYHWLGGLASASFYIPYRGVKSWSWETYWLVGGFFSWIIAPMGLASLLVPDLWSVIAAAPSKVLWLAYFFGLMWGIGGLTFGLTMRYLGIALGMAVALGFCAAFGTLVPPMFEDGKFAELLAHASGRTILAGVAACLAGIGVSGMAGMSKERELSPEQKAATVKEFNFGKGMLVATFSGIMSSCFAFGLAAGKPIGELAKASLLTHGGSDLWQNLPVLVVVLWGGFTTNFIWCVILNLKNRSGAEYLNLRRTAVAEVSAAEGVMLSNAAEETSVRDSSAASHGGQAGPSTHTGPAPLLRNYFFSAIAGVTWYLQFFFYSMGETKMGKYGFSSWTLHMASIIIFSTLWGIMLKEWKGTSKRTHLLIGLGLAVLVGSTMIVGWGNYLGAQSAGH